MSYKIFTQEETLCSPSSPLNRKSSVSSDICVESKTHFQTILGTEMRRNMPDRHTDSFTIKLQHWYAVN